MEVPLYTHVADAREADRRLVSTLGTSACVYTLLDRAICEIVYVGISCYPHARLRTHCHPFEQEPWERGRSLLMTARFTRLPCRRDQTEVIRYDERDYIRDYREAGMPLENKTDGGEEHDWTAYWRGCTCRVCGPWT